MADSDADSRARGAGDGLKILIENSEYWLRNNGDLAMLAVTIGRLREHWPNARIAVLTDSPALLQAYFPQAEGITVFDADPWAVPTRIEQAAQKLGAPRVGPVALGWLRAKVWLPQKARGARRKARRLALRIAGMDGHHAETPIIAPRPKRGSERAVRDASLLVALGGGYLTDADAAQTDRVFTLIDQAHAAGVPVAMVGQGLGPLEDPRLRARASSTLGNVQMIALRENRRGPKLLDEIGVPAERVLVTGDDAIELAHGSCRDALGTGLGVCLRVADYSPVTEAAKAGVGRAVRHAAEQLDAPLVPLIIAEYKSQDRRSTLPLVRPYPNVVAPLGRYIHPSELADRVAECRVLVTGAYHLGVFALAQGIPVVALTSSVYYDDKFLGLQEMFGSGLTLLSLTDEHLETRLGESIDAAWREAPALRDGLRERAKEQIHTSRAGFDRMFGLVDQTLLP